MTRLVLVRHAEPAADMHGRCYGSLDVELSVQGHAAARRRAEELAALPPDAVYSSPRRRARATAEPIAAALSLPLVADNRLRELDFGTLEGRTYDEIAAAEPELYRRWMEQPTTVRFPGGESFADLRERALASLQAIRHAHRCAVVVTHGGVIRAALGEWLSMPDDAVFRLAQDYCGVSIVDWFEDTPLVRVVNAAGIASLSDGAAAPSMTD